MQPRLSVLIPAYNVEPFIEEAVESVRRQTFTDWEIVAVDDASTDRTAALLRGMRNERIRIEENPRNLGMTGNWNRCLSLARGAIVFKLDSDDVLEPRALEHVVGAFDEERELVAAGIRTLLCDLQLEPFDGMQGDDVMQRNGVDPYRDAVHGGRYWYDFAAHGHQLWSSSAFAVRRDVLETLGGWDDRFGCAADTELIWRVLEQERPVAHRGAVGALYRLRPGSVSDEFRSRGWLTWEGVAANLLSLGRVRARRPLRRALRMHYVRLWQRWQKSQRTELPQSICSKLDDVMRAVPPPPLQDVLMTRLRDGVSAS